jgi:WD40 repeat protein
MEYVILEELTVPQISKAFHRFIKLEGSLPCSQQPHTCPYPQEDESNPCHSTLIIRFILILFSYLRLALPTCFFLSGFHTKPCRQLSSPPHACLIILCNISLPMSTSPNCSFFHFYSYNFELISVTFSCSCTNDGDYLGYLGVDGKMMIYLVKGDDRLSQLDINFQLFNFKPALLLSVRKSLKILLILADEDRKVEIWAVHAYMNNELIQLTRYLSLGTLILSDDEFLYLSRNMTPVKVT